MILVSFLLPVSVSVSGLGLGLGTVSRLEWVGAVMVGVVMGPKTISLLVAKAKAPGSTKKPERGKAKQRERG